MQTRSHTAPKAHYADDANEALSVKEAAEILGLSPRTLDRWRLDRVGPPYYKIRSLVRYSRAALIEWRDSRLIESPASIRANAQ